jgi:hypothetical protein
MGFDAAILIKGKSLKLKFVSLLLLRWGRNQKNTWPLTLRGRCHDDLRNRYEFWQRPTLFSLSLVQIQRSRPAVPNDNPKSNHAAFTTCT